MGLPLTVSLRGCAASGSVKFVEYGDVDTVQTSSLRKLATAPKRKAGESVAVGGTVVEQKTEAEKEVRSKRSPGGTGQSLLPILRFIYLLLFYPASTTGITSPTSPALLLASHFVDNT